MIEILTHHHTKYVPSVKKNTNFFIKSTGETITFKTAESHTIQFGGDQLTVARVRSAIKKNVANGDSNAVKDLYR